MNKKRILLILAGVLLIGGGLYWAFRDDIPIPKQGAAVETETMTYVGSTLREEQNGKKVWELTAQLIEIDPQTNHTILKEIEGKFYQDNGGIVTIRAPRAEYNVETKDITISEKVTAESADGATLVADRLFWLGGKRLFNGEGNVRLTRGNTVIVGDKLESDGTFRKFKMTGNAQITQGGTSQ